MSVRDELLTFLRDPERFAGSATDPEVWLSGLETFALPNIAEADDWPLRPAQERAWRGLADHRVGLLLGPPGTGKTHLLSWLIAGYRQARREAGLTSRVFVTAFTRNAVGNVLDAVCERFAAYAPVAPPPLYIGTPPPGGLSDAVERLGRDDDGRAPVAIASGDVVLGGTIWSLYRMLRSQSFDGPTAPLFDLVCIDEASQMVLGHGLLALAGLAPGGRIVVAGDDQQLPPIRAARTAAVGGRELGGSLYAFLKSTQAAEFALDETFRLNAPLTAFPERKFYPGRYASATPDKRLRLRQDWRDGLAGWEQAALDPDLPIVLFVHDGPPAATSNPFEARLAARLAGLLQERVEAKNGGLTSSELFWSNSVAVVSPHRAQNAAIRHMIGDAGSGSAFVETVDRIQGKERDVVLLSYCVADPEFALAEAEFIFSTERLNVAITRARTKLIGFISRRLLEAVPGDQELLDKAELLREFVFSCPSRGDIVMDGPSGREVLVQVRARSFDGAETEIDLTEGSPSPPPRTLTPDLENVLQAIRDLAVRSKYNSATVKQLKNALARTTEPYDECRRLHGLGYVSLKKKPGKYGDFWTVEPFAELRRVIDVDLETVRKRIAEVVRESRQGRLPPFYDAIRDRFDWPASDGGDALLPKLKQLHEEGVVKLGTNSAGQMTVDLPRQRPETETETETELSTAPALSDDDFFLLNALEDTEAKRINFGVFDGWTSTASLARAGRIAPEEVAAALSRLEANGYLMLAADGRIRSRIAELAREVRYVKQRFKTDDADRRPFLVRSLKLEVRDRDKPVRSLDLDRVLSEAAASTPEAAAAAAGIGKTLKRLWGEKAQVAGFQARGMAAVLSAWFGKGCETLAISADTGSGKTEAAVLPMIVAAAADAARGLRGVRAVLTYPRVRLVANQAQRLARYMAALSQEAGMPVVTLGMQVGQVPRSFERIGDRDREAGWEIAGPGAVTFPFFSCPDCASAIHLRPNEGVDRADALVCTRCDWRFAGWIGSKEGLIRNPPALFLPTADSLHQWLNDPQYAPLFGDVPGFAAPRALLADEIHLYTHIHGAQVGLALRRLAARAELNAGDGRRMVAIGMSATIGDPGATWGRLIGRSDALVISPAPDETKVNPRGREYFLFVQPEVESRGKDIAGASTTIQSLMCVAHGMRRRTGDDGGYRSLVFLDSIDKLRRLHGAYMDAEENQELAALRTRRYGDDIAGEPMTACCGEPEGCDRFRDGECWWFAANDRRQRVAAGRHPVGSCLTVARAPIFSGTTGAAEELIKDADVVFATSSLEVGYDDPDITLVYQHYAPQNLASFIQRKGRGGRGTDDRPITCATLSIYSPRDSWWFRRPHEMLAPAGFETPLNPDNFFVRRAQAVCAILDAFARRLARNEPVFDAAGNPTIAAEQEADAHVRSVLGADVWREFGSPDFAAFWADAAGRSPRGGRLTDLRDSLSWAPRFLFDTVNLPAVVIETNEVGAERRPYEDVSLALPTVAPGNATRRFHGTAVHWRPPSHGRAPWLDPSDYAEAQWEAPFDEAGELLAALPHEARAGLADLEPRICRPTRIRLARLGRIFVAGWTPEWVCDETTSEVRLAKGGREDASVRHDSRGSLRGFLLVRGDPSRGRDLDQTPIREWVTSLRGFTGEKMDRRGSGLRLARVYWGCDAEVRTERQESAPCGFAQTFVNPDSGRPLLHGYQVETEGLQFHLCSRRLDDFIAAEMERLGNETAEMRRLSAQFMRYLVESRARGLGVNAYEARRGADLIVAAAGDGDLRKRLTGLLRFWDGAALQELFEEARSRLLAHHPLMSQRRVAQTAEALGDFAFRDLVKSAVEEVKRPGAFSGYLRSVVLHALALKLRQSFVHVGCGDESRVLAHVKLPIQFDGMTDDVISICEAGAHGDGTTRGVLANLDALLEHWRDGFIAECPNAAEDEAMRRFWTMPEKHAAWRRLDPRNPEDMLSVHRELGVPASVPATPTALLRILYGSESVGSEQFDLYDLANDIEAVRRDLASRLGREAHAWELTSAAVVAARADDAVSTLSRILAAYGMLDDAAQEESFSPEARLADQAYRIGAPLCVDGCRGCVHQASELMSDSLVEVTVSRRLLARFLQR